MSSGKKHIVCDDISENIITFSQQIDGIEFVPDFVTEGESKMLIGKFQETLNLRLHEASGTHRETFEDDLPSWINAICERLHERYMRTLPEQVLFIEYPSGTLVRAHLDSRVYGPEIAGISLGDTSSMIFRQEHRQTQKLNLPPRSLYIMRGDARFKATHETVPIEGLRYSITFRTINRDEL